MLKRTLIILLVFIIKTSATSAQNKTYNFKCESDSFCFALQIIDKTKFSDTSLITPFYNSTGMYVLQNGVYNFIINGDKYFLFRVNQITQDSIFISYVFDSTTVISFSPAQEIKLRFESLNNGLVGWPHESMSSEKYSFKIVKQTRFCSLKSEKICMDEGCTKAVISQYQYMTSGYGWKPMYLDDGEGYLVDNSIRQLIYQKKKK